VGRWRCEREHRRPSATRPRHSWRADLRSCATLRDRLVSEQATHEGSPSTAEPEPSSAPPSPLDVAWKDLISRWHDPSAHKAFVVLAAQLDALQDAARRYREAKDRGDTVVVDGYRVPGDPASRAEVASKGLELVLAQALARFETQPRGARAKPTVIFLPIAAGMMLFCLSYAMAQITGRQAFLSAPALAAQALLVALVPWARLRRG
jgi:hypothetical protein